MPIYQFKNKVTEEIIEKTMRVSQLDEFKKENPDLEQYFSNGVMFGDPIRLGIHKPDATFEKYVIGRIKENVKGHKHVLNDKKFNAPREW